MKSPIGPHWTFLPRQSSTFFPPNSNKVFCATSYCWKCWKEKNEWVTQKDLKSVCKIPFWWKNISRIWDKLPCHSAAYPGKTLVWLILILVELFAQCGTNVFAIPSVSVPVVARPAAALPDKSWSLVSLSPSGKFCRTAMHVVLHPCCICLT